MGRYIFKRAVQGIIALFVLITLVFILTRMTGNPVDLLLPPDFTEAERIAMIQKLGLDRSYPVQYVDFIGNAIQGDLGTSVRFQVPVSRLILERMPNTLKLVGFSLLLAFAIAIPLGVITGSRRNSIIDRVARLIGVIGVAAPSFWVALVLMQIFAVNLNILPASRTGGFSHYILPGVSLALFALAGMMRLLRSSMIEVQDSEFVKLARIKGVSTRMVIWKHCLRNSMIPALTFGGMYTALMMGGSIVIETIFAWPGTGRLAYEGIIYRDYPLVQAVVLTSGVFIILVNFAVDVLYSYVDPRIRHD